MRLIAKVAVSPPKFANAIRETAQMHPTEGEMKIPEHFGLMNTD